MKGACFPGCWFTAGHEGICSSVSEPEVEHLPTDELHRRRIRDLGAGMQNLADIVFPRLDVLEARLLRLERAREYRDESRIFGSSNDISIHGYPTSPGRVTLKPTEKD